MAGGSAHVDKALILRQHEFFSELSESAIQRLAARARSLAYRAGETIFSKGDEGHGLLAVLKGVVRISAPSNEGRAVLLNLIGKNEIFGEISLLDGGPRTADATALTDCVVMSLDRRDFLPLLRQEPDIALKALQIVCGRLRRTTGQVEDLSFRECRARLAKTLLRLAEVQDAPAAGEPRLRITQKDLGDIVGLSRESTNRQLREWENAGWVALEKGSCVLKRPDRLAELAEGSANQGG